MTDPVPVSEERLAEAIVCAEHWEEDDTVALLKELQSRRSAEEKMREALEECREWFANQIAVDIKFCCPSLPDGSPDESEMDEESRPMIEETRELLARVEDALSPSVRGGGDSKS